MNLTMKTAEELSPMTERNLARLVEGAVHVKQWVVVGEQDSPAFKLQAWQNLEEILWN